MKRRALRRALTDLGFDEAINFSFIDTAHDDQFELVPAIAAAVSNGQVWFRLRIPLPKTSTRMRPTLLPGLAGIAAKQLQPRHPGRPFVRNWACFRSFSRC